MLFLTVLLCVLCSVIKTHAYSVSWYDSYKSLFNKTYSVDFEPVAYKTLLTKLQYIQDNQLLNKGLTLRLQDMSDVRNSSFIKSNKLLVGRRLGRKSHSNKDSLDYRKMGYVTTPMVQGTCGGCFAIAAVGNLEYWYKKKSGTLMKLSVQEAMDCTRPMTDGCDGGAMEFVFKKAMSNPIGPESFDRFKYHNGRCFRRLFRPYVRVKHYKTINYGVERHLTRYLHNYGPIPVGVDSQSMQFELYHNGIIREQHCGKDIDHAVLVVGYTSEYWIVKNSWGTSWGDKGYFYLERGTNACGIDTYSSFATEVSI